jgi:hypothetical protein
MKRTALATVCVVFAALSIGEVFGQDVNVLVLLSARYGGNTFLNHDDFEHHGWHVTYAGVTQTIQPCNSFQALPKTVDLLVSDVA